MYHNEGGWRPDVNPTDSNQLMRWRRKIEKDDHYVTQMVKISNVSISAADDPSISQSVFTITEKASTRAFSWLKAPTRALTFGTLLRHYA